LTSGNFDFGISQQTLAVRMCEPWFYHGVKWLYQLLVCYSQRSINKNAVYRSVATAVANKQTMSSNNILYSVSSINRIIIVIMIMINVEPELWKRHAMRNSRLQTSITIKQKKKTQCLMVTEAQRT